MTRDLDKEAAALAETYVNGNITDCFEAIEREAPVVAAFFALEVFHWLKDNKDDEDIQFALRLHARAREACEQADIDAALAQAVKLA